MCGILAILQSTMEPRALRKHALALSSRLRHRGPDWSGVYASPDGRSVLCHERLAIVDLETGAQPLLNEDKTIALTVNGEIYNFKELREQLTGHKFSTNSDCEPILHLYEEHGDDFVHMLRGDFSFVLYDSKTGHYLAARDAIGVVPLYMGKHKDGSVWFASECKALSDCEHYESFQPGHLYSSKDGKIRRWFEPQWFSDDVPAEPFTQDVYTRLRHSLEQAVVRRMMCDVPYGVLLSGGLDSSLVASIASRHADMRTEDQGQSKAWWPRLHSFCIGLQDAPDLKAAREVAKFLGTVHHEYNFTVDEGIDALPDVIHHLETYDVTTIRASTPMYFLARRIKAMGVKMVLSGEGSDEIFGGYLYFHHAPSSHEFHRECCRRVRALHNFDCLRANKSTAAWGVEVRVPFLDQDFIETALSVNPEEKLCSKDRIEKHVIRKAFDTPERPYLPESILWRQKEQFSDGVGYSWIGGLKEYTEAHVSDAEFAQRAALFPDDTPSTKEAFYYRRIFEDKHPHQSARASVARWVPTWGASQDPSGRAQQIHSDAYKVVPEASATQS